MCYRNSQTATAEQLEKRFKAKVAVPIAPIFHANAFSYPQWPIITAEAPASIQMLEWGLIPAWAKTEAEAQRLRTGTHNAKSETVFELPSFKSAIYRQRCLVVSTGFYEYKDVNKKKIPYFISLKNIPVFTMAGIYEYWKHPEHGHISGTFSILTTEANPFMASIHNLKKRQPAVLLPENEAAWLQPQLTHGEICDLLRPVSENYFQAHTVNSAVLAANANEPAACAPFAYYEQITLL